MPKLLTAERGKNDLIKETQRVWSKKFGREVSEAEAEQIIFEFRNFIELLKRR